MRVGDTGLSRHLTTGIAACNAEQDSDHLEGTVTQTWSAMLAAAYPSDVAEESPSPSKWHKGFRRTPLTMASANRLFPFSRHVGVGLNIAYPERSDVLDTYIYQLSTPEGLMDYDELFKRACENVLKYGKELIVHWPTELHSSWMRWTTGIWIPGAVCLRTNTCSGRSKE